MPSAVGYLFGPGNWIAGSVLTNPADQTVLVDTGALAAGNYLIAISTAGSVASVFDVQHRDAANAVTLHTQRRRPAAGNDDFIAPNKITLANGERVRVILQGAIVGEIQCSVFFQEAG